MNYCISLSHGDTIELVEKNDWEDFLFSMKRSNEKKIHVFKGWYEGKIYFTATYKHQKNSELYFGENFKSREKNHTPTW